MDECGGRPEASLAARYPISSSPPPSSLPRPATPPGWPRHRPARPPAQPAQPCQRRRRTPASGAVPLDQCTSCTYMLYFRRAPAGPARYFPCSSPTLPARAAPSLGPAPPDRPLLCTMPVRVAPLVGRKDRRRAAAKSNKWTRNFFFRPFPLLLLRLFSPLSAVQRRVHCARRSARMQPSRPQRLLIAFPLVLQTLH